MSSDGDEMKRRYTVRNLDEQGTGLKQCEGLMKLSIKCGDGCDFEVQGKCEVIRALVGSYCPKCEYGLPDATVQACGETFRLGITSNAGGGIGVWRDGEPVQQTWGASRETVIRDYLRQVDNQAVA